MLTLCNGRFDVPFEYNSPLIRRLAIIIASLGFAIELAENKTHHGSLSPVMIYTLLVATFSSSIEVGFYYKRLSPILAAGLLIATIIPLAVVHGSIKKDHIVGITECIMLAINQTAFLIFAAKENWRPLGGYRENPTALQHTRGWRPNLKMEVLMTELSFALVVFAIFATLEKGEANWIMPILLFATVGLLLFIDLLRFNQYESHLREFPKKFGLCETIGAFFIAMMPMAFFSGAIAIAYRKENAPSDEDPHPTKLTHEGIYAFSAIGSFFLFLVNVVANWTPIQRPTTTTTTTTTT